MVNEVYKGWGWVTQALKWAWKLWQGNPVDDIRRDTVKRYRGPLITHREEGNSFEIHIVTKYNFPIIFQHCFLQSFQISETLFQEKRCN